MCTLVSGDCRGVSEQTNERCSDETSPVQGPGLRLVKQQDLEQLEILVNWLLNSVLNKMVLIIQPYSLLCDIKPTESQKCLI